MKNIVYDHYSKDLSVKVKTAKYQKMKQGKYLGGHVPYGLTIPHIYFKAYSKARIFSPDYEEQSRTAAYLSRIEDKIALEERLLCLQKEQKHYLLSAMFI